MLPKKIQFNEIGEKPFALRLTNKILDLESIFFLAYELANKTGRDDIAKKFERIQKSYQRYITALNCNDSDIMSRAVILRRQLNLFIKSLNN